MSRAIQETSEFEREDQQSLLGGSAEKAAAIEPSSFFQEVSTFPSFDEIRNGELFSLSLSNRAANLTHGLHRFAAKYIPRIPGWAIDQFASPNDVVLDPFCGSGTTLVEALGRTQKVIGVDRDGLACLISRAKTSHISPERLQSVGEQLRRLWKPLEKELVVPIDGVPNFSHWFTQSAWGDLQSLLAALDAVDCKDAERNFLTCVFSSILRFVSNADDQTQKTYVSGTLKKTPPSVRPLFWKAFDKAVKGLAELEAYRLANATAEVLEASAIDLPLKDDAVDLIITSPPYLDSVDYMYNFMLEYFWLGKRLGVPSRSRFNELRRSQMGAKRPDDLSASCLPACLDGLIDEADIASSRVGATRAYCSNMSKHFESASRVLKADGRYVLVVGNSKTGDGVLPMHDALIRLAADAGFRLERLSHTASAVIT